MDVCWPLFRIGITAVRTDPPFNASCKEYRYDDNNDTNCRPVLVVYSYS
jgi:hypothetical protein